MGASKRIRGKRARAHWRGRRSHDLRPHYREGDLPATAHVGVVSFEDPYQPAGRVNRAGNFDVEARLEPVQHHDGTLSEGGSERDVRWWGHLLRRCLDVLAKALGFASSTKRPKRPRRVQYDSAPDASEPSLYADAGDLSDLRLHRGRPNRHAK